MATITDRVATHAEGAAVPRLRAIRVQLGTQREAVSAANFGLDTLYSVYPSGNNWTGAAGTLRGTLCHVAVRNPGSTGARASVTAIRVSMTAGTAYSRLITVGTVTVELLGVGA